MTRIGGTMLDGRLLRGPQAHLLVLGGSRDLVRRDEPAGLLLDPVQSPQDAIVDLREAGSLDDAGFELVWQSAERPRTRGCARSVVTASAATLRILEASGNPGGVSDCETVEAAGRSTMSIPEDIT